MADKLISKAVADLRVFVKLVDLVVRMGKLRVQISGKQREKDKLIKEIGLTTFEICHQERRFDGQQIYEAVGRELASAQRLDSELSELQAQVDKVKGDFRSSGGN